MGVLHFLNVSDGDCTVIEHGSGRVTVLDVNNASIPVKEVTALSRAQLLAEALMEKSLELRGNYQQKHHPVNPIEYMQEHSINSVWRFILSHPDMDHMGGLKDFFETFNPPNFWDTDNNEEKDFSNGSGKYNEEDWKFYKTIRDGQRPDITRLVKYHGAVGPFWNQDPAGKPDGLNILAPTQEIMQQARESGDNNDCSYVLLYKNCGFKILLAGDSHDITWEHILENCENDVRDVDLLIAPHHGRDSGRSYDFLDTLKPKMTFFGCALSDHLAYDQWSRRGLPVVTNNQANCMVVAPGGENLDLYVTNETFARNRNEYTFYSDTYNAWYYGVINKKTVAA